MIKCMYLLSPALITYVICSIQPWLQAEEKVKSEVPQQNLQSVDDRAKLDGQSVSNELHFN